MSKYPLITQRPGVNRSRPYVQRTGTPTWVLADGFFAGDSIAKTAEEYGLTVEEVEAAIRFEVKSQRPASVWSDLINALYEWAHKADLEPDLLPRDETLLEAVKVWEERLEKAQEDVLK